MASSANRNKIGMSACINVGSLISFLEKFTYLNICFDYKLSQINDLFGNKSTICK
jgi:hypothetical protein